MTSAGRWYAAHTTLLSSGTLCRTAKETQACSSLPSCRHQKERISWELEIFSENTLKIASFYKFLLQTNERGRIVFFLFSKSRVLRERFKVLTLSAVDAGHQTMTFSWVQQKICAWILIVRWWGSLGTTESKKNFLNLAGQLVLEVTRQLYFQSES